MLVLLLRDNVCVGCMADEVVKLSTLTICSVKVNGYMTTKRVHSDTWILSHLFAAAKWKTLKLSYMVGQQHFTQNTKARIGCLCCFFESMFVQDAWQPGQ
jgi:hypothetical protein